MIRPATKDDLPALIDIWTEISRAEFVGYIGQENVEYFIRSGELALETERLLGQTFVALRNERIAGFIVIVNDLIELLLVQPSYQNRMVGKQLFRFGLWWIATEFEQVSIECFADNHRINPIVHRLGFEKLDSYMDEMGFETYRYRMTLD